MSIFFKGLTVLSPLDGDCIPLNEVKDEMFSQEMMGPGCAIIPKNGEVISPIKGTVTVIAPTKHCIGLTGDDGLEILIHMGIDSFKTEGKGFEYHVNVGDEVKKGQILLNADLSYFRLQKIDMTTPVIVLNSDQFKIKETKKLHKSVNKGETLIKYGS